MKRLIYIFCVSIFVFGCGSPSPVNEGSEGENPDGGPNEIDKLTVNLQFPHKDELCNTGTDITPTQSTVVFEWEASDIAESYTIFVTNLVDGSTIQQDSNEDKIGVVLNRATPYSWYVISKAGAKTAESETWKFYNAGEGVETYAPFPATIDAPAMAASVNPGTVRLRWTGSDVDNDIVGYDVYLGTNNNPDINTTDVTTSELNVSVTTGTIYYWKIVTKDAVGNTSESGVFQFRVL